MLCKRECTTAVGSFSKKGYQRVNVSMEYLKEAISFLEECDVEFVDVFMKTDCPMQIGKEMVGFIIVPRVVEKGENRYQR